MIFKLPLETSQLIGKEALQPYSGSVVCNSLLKHFYLLKHSRDIRNMVTPGIFFMYKIYSFFLT